MIDTLRSNPHHGAGHRLQLDRLPAPVNIGFSDGKGSGVVVGPSPQSPIGPKVVLGVTGAKPGEEQATSYMAHLSPDEAIQIAAMLMEAAATIAEAEGGKPS